MRQVRTVLIDGPSGSGKTSFAEALSKHWGIKVVHLDDFYPGWGGLSAAAEAVARDVLHSSHPGYRRWDWEESRPADWVSLQPGEPLIVEGVGAVTAASISAARRRGTFLTVRIDAPVDVRKRRALERDPDYAPWWEMWAEQERAHWLRHGDMQSHLYIK